jgi:hypothetical protein
MELYWLIHCNGHSGRYLAIVHSILCENVQLTLLVSVVFWWSNAAEIAVGEFVQSEENKVLE